MGNEGGAAVPGQWGVGSKGGAVVAAQWRCARWIDATMGMEGSNYSMRFKVGSETG